MENLEIYNTATETISDLNRIIVDLEQHDTFNNIIEYLEQAKSELDDIVNEYDEDATEQSQQERDFKNSAYERDCF